MADARRAGNETISLGSRPRLAFRSAECSQNDGGCGLLEVLGAETEFHVFSFFFFFSLLSTFVPQSTEGPHPFVAEGRVPEGTL